MNGCLKGMPHCEGSALATAAILQSGGQGIIEHHFLYFVNLSPRVYAFGEGGLEISVFLLTNNKISVKYITINVPDHAEFETDGFAGLRKVGD